MKVGIFGGTFNPIHNGHLLIAENAYTQFQLDKVVFLPAGIPPHKQSMGILDGKRRIEMVASAIKDIPYFTYDPIEVEQQCVNYTYQTLYTLKQTHDSWDLYFIMGADSLLYFDKWVKPDAILQQATILAAVRDGVDTTDLQEKIESIRRQYSGNLGIIHTPEFNVSSHDIRKRVADKQSIRFLVPEAVRTIIQEEKLYTEK
ncbi:MAG: nicotinate-nucleotide adenylyltransferase [Lachnospiraceae bacterium]|jgi:nicotinate-nucleotide adenylyltransferase|nr:nicotinate-nucleotide adenylyltransferase [Lachnospiraceae bacterium]